jgi:hypothetical protein
VPETKYDANETYPEGRALNPLSRANDRKSSSRFPSEQNRGWPRYWSGTPKRFRNDMEGIRTMAPLPFLDWPPDLFAAAHAAAAASLVPPMSPSNENKCACGCNQSHNRAVSAVIGESGDRRVLWFRTIACKNKRILHWMRTDVT